MSEHTTLRAYTPDGAGTLHECTCVGDPVVHGSPTDSRLVGWLHTAECDVTQGLLQREAEAGVV